MSTSIRNLMKTGLAAGAGFLLGKGITEFQRDMQETRARLIAGSRVVQTAHGPIEYATTGEGYPVLSIHGSIGGYDQGLLLGKMAIPDGFRLIAPSRFGFLRTPFPKEPIALEELPAVQADAFASLLDALGIERAVVIGFSAGGPAALQFALRHPQRVSALVLLSAALWAPPAPETKRNFPLPRAAYDVILNSDFILWLAMKTALPAIQSAFAVSKEMQACLTPEEKTMLDNFFHAMLPTSLRKEGILHDGPAVDALVRYNLEQVQPPTLVVSAKDDRIAPLTWGEYTAQHIPEARFILYESGGHTLAGNHERLKHEVAGFLAGSLVGTNKPGPEGVA